MNTNQKQKHTLITVLITVFICLISAANSHASSDINSLTQIVSHKMILEKIAE